MLGTSTSGRIKIGDSARRAQQEPDGDEWGNRNRPPRPDQRKRNKPAASSSKSRTKGAIVNGQQRALTNPRRGIKLVLKGPGAPAKQIKSNRVGGG